MSNLKRNIASILVILSMAFVLFGCDTPGSKSSLSDKERFVGSWKATVDMADLFNEGMKQSIDDMAEYVHIDKLDLAFLFTFNADETYSISVDKDSIKNGLESAKPALKNGVIAYLEDMIEENDLGMSVDELLETSGASIDDLIDENFNESIFEDAVEGIESNGKWKVENGKLYTVEGTGYDFNEDDYLPYEFTSDGIKLSAPEGVDEELAEMLFPMILKKN